MTLAKPRYDRLLTGTLLAATAGGLDSYTYFTHGEVFAGLQTGNLILLGSHIGLGNWSRASHYLIAILMFMVGTIVARFIQHRYHEGLRMSRQTFIVTYEIVLIVLAGAFAAVMPNMVSVGLLSMAAAAQLQEFRQLKGKGFTSLMMTGNLRTFAEAIYDGIFKRDTMAWDNLTTIGTILFGFVVGAALNGLLIGIFHGQTIFLSAIILVMTVIASHRG
ncbi:YoaK family protein [Secundilactobacillus paracollinoides]|uniref:YoaK family protein n=1 Tax=Secundilactobacillus paracollinoides TaxID=240427 RepID=UPI0006EFE50F|nr:YoaK family protein [Secundilactobacillus paracollinoides]KRL80774.1 hypothetical protein FC17_GL003146 [Secundilactobacillus paracollinoides DSM 15502 = JCM 11969]